MKSFIKMAIGTFLAILCAKFFSWGLSAPNSSAADLLFGLGFFSLMGGLYCFLGDLFE